MRKQPKRFSSAKEKGRQFRIGIFCTLTILCAVVLCVGTYSAYFPKQVTIESSLRINNMLNNVEEKPKSQFVKPYLRSEEQEDTTNSADNVSLTKEERVEKTNRKRREQLLSHNDKAKQRLKDIEDMHANKHVTGVQPDGIDDTVTSIVECETTQGPLTVDVRAGWSPNGANQFLKLVDLGHFTDLPFNRVCPKYITQFGRKYVGEGSEFKESYLADGGVKVIEDDPSMWGKRDMNFGYMFFAGSGKQSRHSQMVVALCPSTELCRATGLGRAYWETPIGTIRENDFQVLKNIQASGKPYPRLEMAGQHPKAAGPDEGRVMSDKGYLKKEYPFMEYWKKCTVVNRDIRQIIPIAIKTRIDKVDDNKVAVAEVRGSSIISDKKFSSTDPYRVRMRIEVSNNPNGPLGIREGEIVIEVNPAWSPLGARRFFNMVQSGFFSDCKFFRVLPKFITQWGIASEPALHKRWQQKSGVSIMPSGGDVQEMGGSIRDDPPNNDSGTGSGGNKRGRVTFAMSGPHTRTTQLFVNTVDNHFLDKQGFTPIGTVVQGMEYMEQLNSKYGEKPNQSKITQQGNSYLDSQFPFLSKIIEAKIE